MCWRYRCECGWLLLVPGLTVSARCAHQFSSLYVFFITCAYGSRPGGLARRFELPSGASVGLLHLTDLRLSYILGMYVCGHDRVSTHEKKRGLEGGAGGR